MRDADSAAFDPIKRSPAASGQSIEWKGKVQGRQMEVGLIFKIAAVGILVTILSQVLKHSGREEHAFLLSLAALLLVLHTYMICFRVSRRCFHCKGGINGICSCRGGRPGGSDDSRFV